MGREEVTPPQREEGFCGSRGEQAAAAPRRPKGTRRARLASQPTLQRMLTRYVCATFQNQTLNECPRTLLLYVACMFLSRWKTLPASRFSSCIVDASVRIQRRRLLPYSYG